MITCVFLLEEKRAKIKNYFQNTKYLCFSHLFSCSKEKIKIFIKNFAKRFGVLKFVRIFAIPNSSGGGEMVDTLL